MSRADRRPLSDIDRAVRDDAAATGIPVGLAWSFLLLPFVAAVALVLTVPHPRVYHFLIEEDHVIEWLQFAAILAAAGVFAVAARRSLRNGRLALAALFVLVASGAFVVAGEEISWGQRILGLVTPDALKEINHQGETNIHNISALQRLFNVGEMIVGLYGFTLPLLWRTRRFRDWFARLDPLLIPPLSLVSLFFLPFAYRAFRAIVLPEAGERITEFGELPELTLYIAILVTGIVIVRSLGRQAGPQAA
jgi:hypothetical protein